MTEPSVIDLTDDSKEVIIGISEHKNVINLVESDSQSTNTSENDSNKLSTPAIVRTLVDNNGEAESVPFSIPTTTRTLPNILEDVRIVKTVKIPRKSKPKAPKIQSQSPILIPADSPTSSLKASVAPVSDKKCPVCFDVLQNPSVTLCGHVYCTECISMVVKTTKQCPICRKKLTARGFHPLYL